MSYDSEELDITGKIGPLYIPEVTAQWPMYSYSRPAYTFWNGFAKGLAKRGFTLKEIGEELQSKGVRWMLDAYEDQITKLGESFAKDYHPYEQRHK